MTDMVYAGWLTQTELQTLLAPPSHGLDWIILEAVDELALDSFHTAIDLTRFTTGRIFGESSELRWRLNGQKFHTLLIGNVPEPIAPLNEHHQELVRDQFDYQEREYFLWGEWTQDNPVWLEARIPHIFTYPLPPQRTGRWRRKIKAVEYVRSSTGDIEFYRFTDIFEVAL